MADSQADEYQARLSRLAFDGADLALFRRLLDEKPMCLNGLDPSRQQTLIYAACRNGKLEFVKELLDRGCDLTLNSGEMQSTPAHAVVQHYNEKGDAAMDTVLAIMRELLDHGQTMVTNSDSATPLAELYTFLSYRPLVYRRGPELFQLLATNVRTYRRCGASLADEAPPQTEAAAAEDVLVAALLEQHLWAAGTAGVTLPHPKRREWSFITFYPCVMEVVLEGQRHAVRIVGWPGNDFVQWQWSPPDRALWLAVDPEVSQQLATEPTTVQIAAGVTYEVKLADFTLSGTGPQDGWRLRWCPVEVEALSCLSGGSDLDLAELLAAPAVAPGEEPLEAPPAPLALPATEPPAPPAPTAPIPPLPPPPVTWASFSLVPDQLLLKDGVLALAVALPRVAGLADLRLEPAPDAALRLLVPDGAAPQLRAVLDRLEAAEARVAQALGRLTKEMEGMYHEVTALCRKDASYLSPKDPLKAELKKYYERLREDFQAEQQRARDALHATVAHRAPTWMAEVAANAGIVPLVQDYLDREVTALVEKSVPEFVSSVPEPVPPAARWAAKVMKDHMLSQEPDWSMLSPKGKDQYDYTCKSILRGFRKPDFCLQMVMRRYLIHLTSVKRGLPFYGETAKAFLQNISRDYLCIVTTSTGSGKSTLMPLLLYAEQPKPGREHRIAVTQPRRFAAENVCDCIAGLYGPQIAGFRMAGRAKNPDAPIVYITDGLLRTLLNPTVDFAAHPFPFDTVVIDEVHERSMEIDACLALLAMQQRAQWLQGVTVTKVILSSATFDEEVKRPWTAMKIPKPLATQLTRRFHVVEHYLDKHCATPQCPYCGILAASQHEVDVVLRAQRFLRGSEQLLCFLPTVVQVTTTVKVLQEHHVQAFPLYAQQSGKQQKEALERERVFIATNIAETSLTFPNLKVVVDAGKVQRTELTDGDLQMSTKDASEATLDQRRGRAGRTCDGHYVALFSHASRAARPKQIPAKMGLEDPEALQYSLRRQLQPTEQLTIPLPTGDMHLDPIDDDHLRLPPVGTMKMAKALLAAKDFRCELEVLHVAALKMTFSPKVLLEVLAKCPLAGTGDIATAVALHKRLVSDVDVISVGVNQGPKMEAACRTACGKHGVPGHVPVLSRSIRLFRQLREVFIREKKRPPYSKATTVTQALAAGFPEGLYGCMKLLDGPSLYYSRLKHRGDCGDTAKSQARTIYSFHSKCSIKKARPNFVFALEFMLFGDGLEEGDDAQRKRFATLQMAEIVDDITKFDHCETERFVRLHASDPYTGTTQTINGVRYAVLKGPLGSTIDAEIKLRESLRVTEEPTIFTAIPDLLKQQVARHFETISSNKSTFQPLKNQWGNMFGTQLVYINLKQTPAKMKVVGRREDVQRLQKQLQFWEKHVITAPIAQRADPYGLALYQRPRLVDTDDGFAQRLHRVSAPKLTYLEKFSASVGPAATRETRMELVANVAINSFKCKLAGGFVRDWVVRGKADHGPYSGNVRDWVDDKGVTHMERYPMKEEHNGKYLVPRDLDFELPEEYFDAYRFINEVQSMDIEVNYHQYIAQRHVFLFECKRGPFTADFVESHFAMLHAVADLDVNVLAVQAPFHNMLGLKMKLPPKQFTIDGIVEHCRNGEMVVMRADGNIKQRVDKMVRRGWRVVDTVFVQPDYDDPSLSSLTVLKDTDELWERYRQILQPLGMTMQMMWIIHNTNMKSQFEALRDRIAVENSKNPNVRELFHGTKEPAARSILNSGFDDHCWGNGNFGRGAYFADGPCTLQSHGLPGTRPPPKKGLTDCLSKCLWTSKAAHSGLPCGAAPCWQPTAVQRLQRRPPLCVRRLPWESAGRRQPPRTGLPLCVRQRRRAWQRVHRIPLRAGDAQVSDPLQVSDAAPPPSRVGMFIFP